MTRLKLVALQIAVGLALVALWHVGSTVPIFGRTLLPPFFFSTPADVAMRVAQMVAAGKIWPHIGITLLETALSFAIGAIGGIAFGFGFALLPTAAAVFEPYIKMANSLPRVVLAPIFMLWLGLGIWSKVALGVSLVFFIVFFNVYRGIQEVSPVILANARLMGLNEFQLFRHVYWPSALSWMFSSLHTSVGFALVGAVVGEYLGASAGLGYLIHEAEGVFDTTGVFAGMAVLAFFVLAIDFVVTALERRMLHWQPGREDART